MQEERRKGPGFGEKGEVKQTAMRLPFAQPSSSLFLSSILSISHVIIAYCKMKVH